MPELALLRGGGVLIEYGDDKETAPIVVRSQELFEYPSPRQLRGGDRFDSAFTGEDAITSALDRLRQGKGVKVAFTTGHGEPKPDDMGGKGLGNWRARLARVGYEVIRDPPGPGRHPRGPVAADRGRARRTRSSPTEAARLKAYVDRGKPVLLLLGNEHRSGLEELLKAYNLEIGKGIVHRPQVELQRQLGGGRGAVAGRGGPSDRVGDGGRPRRAAAARGADLASLGHDGGSPARRRPTRWTRAWSPRRS